MVQASSHHALAVCYRDFLAMERIEKTVFLSYRRTNISWALAIYQNLTLKPDFALPFNNRGIARHNKGNLEGAIQDYNEAIRLKPDAIAFNDRGVARNNKGDREGANEDFERAKRLRATSNKQTLDKIIHSVGS